MPLFHFPTPNGLYQCQCCPNVTPKGIFPLRLSSERKTLPGGYPQGGTHQRKREERASSLRSGYLTVLFPAVRTEPEMHLVLSGASITSTGGLQTSDTIVTAMTTTFPTTSVKWKEKVGGGKIHCCGNDVWDFILFFFFLQRLRGIRNKGVIYYLLIL